MMLRDSTEVDELLYPIVVWADRSSPTAAAPGRFRGAPASYVEYGPADTEIHCDVVTRRLRPSRDRRPRRLSGHAGAPVPAPSRRLGRAVAGVGRAGAGAGETVYASSTSGGGYGPPWERDVGLVLDDIRSGLVSREQAADVYAVIVDEAGRLDAAATDERRERAREAREQPRPPEFAQQAQLIADRLADYVRPPQDR